MITEKIQGMENCFMDRGNFVALCVSWFCISQVKKWFYNEQSLIEPTTPVIASKFSKINLHIHHMFTKVIAAGVKNAN